jgi:hypothetical protein
VASLDQVCGTDIAGGTAVTGSTVYLPCVGGIVAVRVAASPPGVRLLWSSRTGGGPPIVAGGLVWTLSRAGTLYGLDPRTGQVRQQAAVGTPANHFPTPSAGAGLLLAPAANQVVAFHATGAPGAAPPAPGGAPGQAGGPGGGLSGGAVAGIAAVSLVVLGGIGLLLWRRVLARPQS